MPEPLNSGTFPTHGKEVGGQDPNSNNTTSFQNDAVGVTAEMVDPTGITPAYYNASESYVSQTIPEFLGKPMLVQKGTMAPTDTTTTFTGFVVPNASFTGNNLYLEKSKGYLGFRATTVITLQVNASRFQQGLYMLTYVPIGGSRYSVNLEGNYWVDSHSSSLTARTQLPHVNLDVNCDTSVTLRIPFSSTLDYFPFSSLPDTNDYGAWGYARIYPYVPLSTDVTSPDCNYAIWMHFEDVELIGPSVPQTVEYQAGEITRRVKKKNVNPSEKEAQSGSVGPISSVAFSVAKAARYLTPIPMLADFAGPVSWAADIVGNVASVFGWSAPINLAPVGRMIRANAPYATNVTKVDNSFPLSLEPSNMVEILPGFGATNRDELDIVNFASIPFYNYTFTWSTATATGTELLSWNVSPADNIKTQVYGTQTAYLFGPCQYLAMKFQYWRGSMRYNFKFVKTEFHSGRISISYTPYESRSVKSIINSEEATNWTLREVVDVREANEFELIVPYISSTPYKVTKNDDGYMGQISIRVVDELIAPDSVSNSITCVVEMSAGPDIEYAGVSNVPFTPVSIVTYQSAMDTSPCALNSVVIGNASTPKFQLETSKAAIGERVTNLRALLKRFYPIIEEVAVQPVGSITSIFPWSFAVAGYAAGVPDEQPIAYSNDLLGELTSFFMYGRGGVRLKYLMPGDTAVNVQGFLQTVDSTSNLFPSLVYRNSALIDGSSKVNSYISSRNNYVYSNDGENLLEVQVPQYHFTHSRNNACLAVGDFSPVYLRMTTGTTTPRLAVSVCSRDDTSTADMNGAFMRAAADDFNLSFFVSIPPLFRSTFASF